jgi:hypothetical protein
VAAADGDHLFAPGHRIGVVLISTERDQTLRYPAGTTVGVRTGVSRVTSAASQSSSAARST